MSEYLISKDIARLELQLAQQEQRLRQIENLLFSDDEEQNNNNEETPKTEGQEHR